MPAPRPPRSPGGRRIPVAARRNRRTGGEERRGTEEQLRRYPRIAGRTEWPHAIVCRFKKLLDSELDWMPRAYQALIGMARWDVEHEGTARDFAKGTKFTIELDADHLMLDAEDRSRDPRCRAGAPKDTPAGLRERSDETNETQAAPRRRCGRGAGSPRRRMRSGNRRRAAIPRGRHRLPRRRHQRSRTAREG